MTQKGSKKREEKKYKRIFITSDLLEKLKWLVADVLNISKEEITSGTVLIDDLALDSLDL